MRVIWATPSLPHPHGTGGCVHEFSLIEALAPRHEIHVVTSAPPALLDIAAVEAVAASVTRVAWTARPYPTTRTGNAIKMIRAKPNLILWLRRDRIGRLATTIRSLADSIQPDLTQITLGEIAGVLGSVAPPTALLLFDSLTRELEAKLAIERLPRRRAQLRLERWRTERFERTWYPQATALASVSSVDAAWFEQVVRGQVDVVENSIPDAMFAPPECERSPRLVTFVGSLNHPPNVDAIEWLVSEIWPLVLDRRPDAELRVVGAGDPEGRAVAALRPLVESVRGRLDHDVDDIRPYYWESAAVVAPVRIGAGMRTKVIHAMATGTPVIATPTALEGISKDMTVHVRVGTTAAEIAAAIARVLDDPHAAAESAAAASAALLPLRIDAVAARLEAWWTRTASMRQS